jgi:hypothetical protein
MAMAVTSLTDTSHIPPYHPPDPVCPICDRDVEAVIYNKHCVDPVISSVVYVHERENHFIVFEPANQPEGWSLTYREAVSDS